MKLPQNQVGVSDVLQYRDCPTRFLYGMRRHEKGAPPESWSPQNAYGSAIHDVLESLGKGMSDRESIQAAFRTYLRWLEPEDLQRMKDDIETYRQRDDLGVRTILREGEISFPLFIHPEHGQVFFRARIDRLYQRLEEPGYFIHRDYKSGRYAKTEKEVHEDVQLWSYNLGIHEHVLHELGIEIEYLEQIYDQLRHGEVPTSKNAEQREQIREWLIAAITVVLDDEKLAPSYNEWCPWCPLKMDCPVVKEELTEFALTRIATLAPREPKLKADGTPGKVLLPPHFDQAKPPSDYLEPLPKVKRARQVLEAYEKGASDFIKEMPTSTREEHGYKVFEKSKRSLPADAQRVLHEQFGSRFYSLSTVSLTAVEREFGKDSDEYRLAESLTVKGAPTIEVRPIG